MRILIATDKFKHSLSSKEACDAIKKGFLSVSAGFEIETMPLADGGEGLIDALQAVIEGDFVSVKVHDPLFRLVDSGFFLSADRQTAFIEMSKASGLGLLKPEEYNCRKTSTFGTGELLKAAIEKGAKRLVLGIGGSATNDGGIGMAAALGYRFLDKSGQALAPLGENLIKIETIEPPDLDLKNIKVDVASDVSNPLTGPRGATMVYAPQKGADPEMIAELELGMLHFSEILKAEMGIDIAGTAGAGAAGGLGGGCIAFLNARIQSGIELILGQLRADEKIKHADLIITGEGKIDAQSLDGKVIAGVAGICKKHSKPVIAFCGLLELQTGDLKKLNLNAAFPIQTAGLPPGYAIKHAGSLLEERARGIARQLKDQQTSGQDWFSSNRRNPSRKTNPLCFCRRAMAMDVHKFKVAEKEKPDLTSFDTSQKGGMEKEEGRELLESLKDELFELQERLYADNSQSLLIIFQAMDAGGKDSAIKHVMSGLNPQGCQVYSFKQPNSEELDHDFLWRHYKALPERGRIGIHNRSHYENVLICKVHPELVAPVPKKIDQNFWKKRYESIRNFEKHLTESGTVILKFFLHVSKEEQKQRFLERIDNPGKNWKFSAADLAERDLWDKYMLAYQQAIEHTSTSYAPWYIIPADNKWFCRLAICQIIVDTFKQMDLRFPTLSPAELQALEECRKKLINEKS